MSTACATRTPPTAELPRVVSTAERGFTVDASLLRAWGMKSAISLVDRGLTSMAGFGVNLLLARWIAPEAYGGSR
jgi:hypothetical protein